MLPPRSIQESFGAGLELLGDLGPDGTMLARERSNGAVVVIHSLDPDELSAAESIRVSRVAASAGGNVVKTGRFVFVKRPFIQGTPLSELPAKSAQDLVPIARACLVALDRLHREGFVHGNIKPTNVIVREDGTISIVDGALNRTERSNVSIETFPIDAVRYLAPEQAGLLERAVGPPADLYALGLVWFRCLTGAPAFAMDRVGELLDQHLLAEIPDVRELGCRAPRALAEVIRRMLREDPDDRYQSVAAVLADVQAIADMLASGVSEPALVIGTHDRRSTITEPGLVGMQHAIGHLERSFAAATAGHGAISIVEGESGSGKSRLLRELEARARSRGARVFHVQLTERALGLPYEALASAMMGELTRSATRDQRVRSAIRARLGDRIDAVLDSVPQLEPALGPREPMVSVPEALARMRSLDALTSFLDAVADAEHPALLIFDDMHWADPSTQALVSHWARHREREPSYTMIACSFRPEETPEANPVRALTQAQVVRMERLLDAEVVGLLHSAAGPLPEVASAAAVRRAAGNPLIALAVLHGLVESSALSPAPRGAAESWTSDPEAIARASASGAAVTVLARRLALLPEETLALLNLAAILGREFDLDRLKALAERAAVGSGARGGRFDALRIAVTRHFVWPSHDAKRLTFVHDGIREALLANMDEATKLQLHHSAGQMLEESDRAATAQIAFHFDAAGEYERALPYALEAAEAARGRTALATAASLYQIAERGMANASVATRSSVLVGLGHVLLLLGRYEEAQRRFESALSLAAVADDRAQIESSLAEIDLARGDARGAAERISSALRDRGHRVPRHLVGFVLGCIWHMIVQAMHTALPRWFVGRGAPIAGTDATVLQLYSRLSYALYFTGTIPTIWSQLRQLNLAERHAPGPALAQAWSNHAILVAAIPLFGRALRYSERALALRRQLGEVWGEGQALHFHARVQYAASQFEPAIASAREAMRLLKSAGDRWEYDDAAAVEGLAHYALGDLKTARNIAESLYAAADEIGDVHPRALALQLWAHASGGDVPLELLRDALDAPMFHSLASSSVLVAEGVRLRAAGDLVAATEILERAFSEVRRAKIRVSHVVQIPLLLASALRERAAMLMPWSTEERGALLARARHVMRIGLRAARQFQNYLPFALREAGALAAIEGDRKEAIRRLEASERIARRQGARFELARTSWLLAQIAHPAEIEDARRNLIELGAGFELASSEKPVVLSLADRFARLLECGREIVRSLTRDDVFAAVKKAAMQTLHADQCDVRQLNPTGTRSESADWSQLLARAEHERHAIVVPEALLELSDTGYPSAGVHSAVWAPIYVHGEVAGAVFASHSRIRGLFSQDELRILEFLTALAGAALENAEGFGRAEDAIRARDEFLQIASHEIRTPLTPLKLNLQLIDSLLQLERGVEPATKQKMAQMMGAADRQLDRLTSLLDQLIEASTVGSHVNLEVERVDLEMLARAVVGELQAQIHAAATEVVIDAEHDVIGTWDPLRLRSVVASLLSNAMKFGEHRNVIVTVRRSGDTAILSVRDFGIGIAVVDQARVFQRLERAVSARHFGGLGLGLYLARRLVEAHGGTLRVESAGLGRGATFIVELPLTP
ncbi:MAG TPA: BREX system ATP-binding domain-containing protein [Kofleriaceae bacterium]|nr:BREX system ATP-binding domain-containing protein [Kofleriaceae bacterium]